MVSYKNWYSSIERMRENPMKTGKDVKYKTNWKAVNFPVFKNLKIWEVDETTLEKKVE